MLLSRKSLGRLAALALEDLESWTKNEITSTATGRRKFQKVIVLGQRGRYAGIVAAKIARETTHDKDKKSAPGATGGIASASRARTSRGTWLIVDNIEEQSVGSELNFGRSRLEFKLDLPITVRRVESTPFGIYHESAT